MTICPDCQTELDASVKCAACGWSADPWGAVTAYLSSRDRESALFRDYRSNYDVIAEDDLEESIQPVDYLVSQTERLLGYLPPIEGRSVCEVGVGQGHLFRRLAERDPGRLVGVDVAVPYLERLAGDGIGEVIVANAENLPFSGEFDVVIATDILEHVVNPGDFLLSAHRSLREGGSLIVRVPYRENLTAYARQRGCPYDYVHLRTFDRAILRDTLEGAGFKVTRFHYDGWFRQRFRWSRYDRMVSRLRRKAPSQNGGAGSSVDESVSEPAPLGAPRSDRRHASPRGGLFERARGALKPVAVNALPETLAARAQRGDLPPSAARVLMMPVEITAVAVREPTTPVKAPDVALHDLS